jgi:hypothetical protein
LTTPRVNKRASYKKLFFNDSDTALTPDAEAVLKDLASFCGAYKSAVMVNPISGNIDSHAMAVAEGRREVWLRVQAMLNLEDSILLKGNTYEQ